MASATEEAPKLAEEAPDKQEDAEPREQKQESQQQEPAPAGPEPERPTKRQKTAKFAGLPLEKPLALESLYKGQPAPASSPVKLIGDQTDAAHAHSNREFLQRQLEAVKTLYGVYRVEYNALLEELRTSHQEFESSTGSKAWKQAPATPTAPASVAPAAEGAGSEAGAQQPLSARELIRKGREARAQAAAAAGTREQQQGEGQGTGGGAATAGEAGRAHAAPTANGKAHHPHHHRAYGDDELGWGSEGDDEALLGFSDAEEILLPPPPPDESAGEGAAGAGSGGGSGPEPMETDGGAGAGADKHKQGGAEAEAAGAAGDEDKGSKEAALKEAAGSKAGGAPEAGEEAGKKEAAASGGASSGSKGAGAGAKAAAPAAAPAPGAKSQLELAAYRGRFVSSLPEVAALEALASAITEQDLDAHGAVACLAGRTGRFLIRRTTVLLGRAAESKGEVDVDLAQEGPAAKVSRRQAYLSLAPSGAFSLTNAGRRVVMVDGQPVAQFGSAEARHLSLIEVGGLRLMLFVNSGAVERALRRGARAAL